MDIKRDRMVFLGYGKYWRSDAIIGLMPIEEDRGPKRRTNVFVEGRVEPIVASRTEQSILDDMGASGGGLQALREAVDGARVIVDACAAVSRTAGTCACACPVALDIRSSSRP